MSRFSRKIKARDIVVVGKGGTLYEERLEAGRSYVITDAGSDKHVVQADDAIAEPKKLALRLKAVR